MNLTYWVKKIKFDLIFLKKNMTLASGGGHHLIFVCLFVSQETLNVEIFLKRITLMIITCSPPLVA